jgi:hypothetical protein
MVSDERSRTLEQKIKMSQLSHRRKRKGRESVVGETQMKLGQYLRRMGFLEG